MIALDTNVLVRFLVQDDPLQAQAATKVIDQLTDEAQGFVSREVLIELVWVLERAYRLSRAEIAVAFDGLLAATELEIEDADEVAPALELYRNDGFGFADLMIVAAARRAGAAGMVTFDRKAARLSGVRLLVED
ncbi:type II toxin-antitoxin system VapC family toxin [Thalassobacter stenotrophicus]|uniref:PIN domain-containing protein n=1 Tax=Thalassobacter stenotrophicus TaxID=266809 RepID=UPI0022A93DD1|nr:type II toxin-antitoxin system VapC family toxin [Thalassobacter stenotrophicus]UYP68537.1 type II toxin-antitoxin system VapC family toxin [Thalassobacter stenotrophicus]